MKVQELRIGNILEYRTLPVNVTELRVNNQIAATYWDDFISTEDFVGFPLSLDNKFLNPIEITEEWLEKLGFKESEDFGKYELKKIPDIAYHLKSKTLSIANKYARTSNVSKVHELQNIFYSLIGEELL